MEPLQRCQSLEISNLDIFFRTSIPDQIRQSDPPRKFSFLFGPPTPPHRAISREKRGYICQRLQLVDYSSNQTLAYIGVTKKKLSPFCLQRTTRITQENEARNRNTSIRRRVILEFWNIWSLNLRFLCATDPNFPLSGSFGHPYRRAENWLCIRESWHICLCMYVTFPFYCMILVKVVK